jgi:hypothetical protein
MRVTKQRRLTVDGWATVGSPCPLAQEQYGTFDVGNRVHDYDGLIDWLMWYQVGHEWNGHIHDEQKQGQ